MSLTTNKIILAAAASNTAGAYFQTSTVTAIDSGNGTLVPTGIYLLVPSANVTVIANTGSANSTIMAANTGGVVISDGINVWVKNASGNATVTLIGINDGQAAPETFAV
jgi:dUTPase